MTRIVYGLVSCATIILGYHIFEAAQLKFTDEKNVHSSRPLDSNEIRDLASLTNETYFRSVLSRILVPRVVGTASHEKVKEFIGSELSSLGYHIEYDSFEDYAPRHGKLKFTNVIAKLNPNADRFLALSCHYDSKYFSNFEFLAATDSAVPCAMLIHLAKVLTPLIKNVNPKLSLMLIFFDGEEAFVNWSNTDSLYGARYLARKWESMPYETRQPRTSHLNRMDMLVLLDLLGTKDQKFYSFFPETERWHMLLAKTEKKLKSLGAISSQQPLHFLEKSTYSYVEDDHVPFLQRNVPVLHVIPAQFPSVWHTEQDNYKILHFPTITTLNKIFQVFTYAYLHGDLDTRSSLYPSI